MKNALLLRGLFCLTLAVAAGCGGATEETSSATQGLSAGPGRSQVLVQDDGSAIMLSGTYANRDANVTGWDTAQDLGSNSQSMLVGDGAGNAAVITSNGWFVNSARRYVAGQGWSAAFGLSTGTAAQQTVTIHAAAFDGAGDLVVVGSARYAPTNEPKLFVARHSLTAGWSAPAIETTAFAGADGVSAAINQNGDVVVVHVVSQSAHVQTWAERYTRAGGWSSSRLDADPEAQINATPLAAIDAAGNATAVWSEYAPGGTDAFHKANPYDTWWTRFTPGTSGTWATPQRLVTTEKPVSLLADRAGNVMLMTQQFVGVNKAFVRRFSSGVWGGATQIDQLYALGSRLTGSVEFPAMTLDRQGNATIVWEYLEVDTSLRPHYTLKAQRYAVGYGWQSTYVLSPSKLDYGYPSFGVAAGGDAQARVYWSDGTRSFMRRFLRGTGWLTTTEMLWSTQAAPPSIQSISVTPSAATLALSGTPGTTYGIEATSDFTTWRAKGAPTMNGVGQATFVDSSPASMSFYRAVWPATASVNASPCVDLACVTP